MGQSVSAIYQRARPIHWDEVVGQEHIKGVLKTALEQGRVGHAYLFSGPRGVGKTTTARLIAMTANCTGPAPKPCGECENCRAVRAGSHPDVLEIDAASNNSVEDVRDLREKVGLAPMRGGKKIYILDEAHMMSKSAFNALLKTLEEPPAHVIFILATTEPEKIIPTILSRTQHYRFRRLTAEEIAGKLSGLAEAEGVSAEPEALALMGRLADGAMRDGESLLERMLAAGTAVTRRAVEEALGLPPGEQMRGMAGALVLGDAGAALFAAGELYRAGFAARTVVEGLVEALSQALHAELGVLDGPAAEAARLSGADVPRLLRLQAALDEQESRFSRSADLLSLELALTHALLAADGAGNAAHAVNVNRGERPARAPAQHSAPAQPSAITQPPVTGDAANVAAELAARLSRLEGQLAALQSGSSPNSHASRTDDFDPNARTRRPHAVATARAPQVAAPVATGGTWADVLAAVSMQTRAFLKPARMHAEAGYISLSYDAKGTFHAKQIVTKLDELLPLLERTFGPVTLELITADGGRKFAVGRSTTADTRSHESSHSREQQQTDSTDSMDSAASTGVSLPKPQEQEPLPTGDAVPSAVQLERERVVDDFDPLARRAPAPRRETAPAPEALRPAGPPTPDDMAAAPLPADPPPWQESPTDEPPLPAGTAEHTPETPAETATRELYLGEPITEEPTWEDFGLPPEGSGDLAGGAARGEPASGAATRSVSTAAVPKPQPSTSPAAGVQVSAAVPIRDIRAHPLYEEIRGRFSGEVREIGKNRKPPPTPVNEESASGDAE